MSGHPRDDRGDLEQAGRELAERSCAAQGLPVKIGRAELDRLAPLFRVASIGRAARCGA